MMDRQPDQGAHPVDRATHDDDLRGSNDIGSARATTQVVAGKTSEARTGQGTGPFERDRPAESAQSKGLTAVTMQDTPAAKRLEDAGSESKSPTFRSLMGLTEPHHGLRVIADHRRNGYVRRGDGGPWTRLDSPKASALVAAGIHETSGVQPRQFDVQEVIEQLKMAALLAPETHDVWLRVACLPNGEREIYLGDPADTRVRIAPGRWRLVPGGFVEVNFYETQATAPFVVPAREGTTKLLEPYLNLDPVDRGLAIAWITFVLAHAKQPGVAFPLLVLGGEQGAGKTSLCYVIQLLTDPSFMGVQSFPRN